LWEFMVRFQSRWRSLYLFVSPECFWDCIINPPSNKWNSLETLAVSMADFDNISQDQYTERMDALASITSLQHLTLFVPDDISKMHKRPYGPSTLYELRIVFDDDDFIFTNVHMSLISGYASLTRLIFRGEGFESSSLPVDHAALPSLQYLSYTASDLSVLKYFTTPALSSLDIHLDQCDRAQDVQLMDLSNFLDRCTNALQSVAIDTDFNNRSLSAILPLLYKSPSLTNLTVNARPFQEWPPDGDKSAWCPKLQNLTINLSILDQGRLEGMEDLAAFLKRRFGKEGRELNMLTIRKTAETAQVPNHIFKFSGIRKLRVTVPW
jgi:hypothetical protein